MINVTLLDTYKMSWCFEKEVVEAFKSLLEMECSRDKLWVFVRQNFPYQLIAIENMLKSGKIEPTGEPNTYVATESFYEFLQVEDKIVL